MNNAELIKWREEKDFPEIQEKIDDFIDEHGMLGRAISCAHAICDLEEELKERQQRMMYHEKHPDLAPYLRLNKSMFLLQFKKLKKYKQRLHLFIVKMYGKVESKPPTGTITEEMIEQAREYPIENIIDVRRGMGLCIFHDDHKPSMYVKNNFSYCFSCGKKEDSIGVYRKLNGVSFVEAVKALQ